MANAEVVQAELIRGVAGATGSGWKMKGENEDCSRLHALIEITAYHHCHPIP